MLTILVIIGALVVVVLGLTKKDKEKKFGLDQLKAAIGIDPNMSARSLRAVVVGALGYIDKVDSEIAEAKAAAEESLDGANGSIDQLMTEICEVKNEGETKKAGIGKKFGNKIDVLKTRIKTTEDKRDGKCADVDVDVKREVEAIETEISGNKTMISTAKTELEDLAKWAEIAQK